jgi:hypothetical protein
MLGSSTLAFMDGAVTDAVTVPAASQGSKAADRGPPRSVVVSRLCPRRQGRGSTS